MASTTLPWVKPQFFTSAGVMASGYKLFTYDAGTTTKRATYTDSALTSANANPIVLDAYGRASIYLSPTSYKLVFAPPTDSDPPIAAIWTADNISASSTLYTSFDLSGTAGETITANDVVYLSDGSGGLTAGRWYKADADFTYASSLAVEVGIALAGIASGSTGSIRQVGQMTGLSGLTAGTLYYVSATAGALTSTAPTNALLVGKADSTTSLILDPSWGVGNATTRGMMGILAQTIAGAKTFNTQPQTYIGTAITLPATIAGVFFVDTTVHSVGINQANVAMTDTTIPANLLDVDGKCIWLAFGSPTTTVGSGAGSVTIKINIGGTSTSVVLWGGSTGPGWFARARIVRKSSSSVELSSYGSSPPAGGGLEVPFTVVIAGLTFTAAITLKTTASTGTDYTVEQSYFIARAI